MSVYTLELLSKQPIQIKHDDVLVALKKTCGAVDSVMNSAEKGSHAFGFLDYKAEFKDGGVPVQFMLNRVKHEGMRDDVQASLQQTWGWEDAKTIVPQCRDGLLIVDFLAGALAYRKRVALWNKVLQAVLSTVTCEAIHWKMSQQFTNAKSYLAERSNPLFGMLNVRMFNIQNTNPQEFVMDTLGLAPFGLPDIQMHFRQLDPNHIANFLYNVGSYVFEQGDVIQDGQTVESLPPGKKWRCQHEVALVAPEREVLDVNPNAPYAAGQRD